MNRIQALLLVVAAACALGVVFEMAGCYKKLPPCTPDRVDWPRCNSDHPPFPAARRDGGVH